MDLCLTAEWRPGQRVSNHWWQHNMVDVEGIRTAYWEAEQIERVENTYWTKTRTD